MMRRATGALLLALTASMAYGARAAEVTVLSAAAVQVPIT